MRRYIKHVKTQRFRKHYQNLPYHVQQLADKSFALLKQNPAHPSLTLKKVRIYWSARVGPKYRTFASEREGTFFWFWIGAHDEYMRLIND
ncbi:MAG: hypothetical protein OXL96_10085 [Candidatus Poribacteria bacterium]|nr:hypothetical protein [Candidatus Poribacteria bacterium]